MSGKNQPVSNNHGKPGNVAVSRRVALGSSGLAVLGLLSRSAFGRAEGKGSTPQLPKEIQERMDKSRAFSERMRAAQSMEERMKIMAEQRAWERARAVEDLKDQLRLSEQEWPVVKPRLQAVYDLVHPRPPVAGRNEPRRTEVEQRRQALGELLRDEKAPADQIKANLMALRAAKQRAVQQLMNARQGLRELLTLRQEALLVLNGLLD